MTRWNAFIKKKKAMVVISLKDTITTIRKFLGPVVESIENDTSFSEKWSYEEDNWV